MGCTRWESPGSLSGTAQQLQKSKGFMKSGPCQPNIWRGKGLKGSGQPSCSATLPGRPIADDQPCGVSLSCTCACRACCSISQAL